VRFALMVIVLSLGLLFFGCAGSAQGNQPAVNVPVQAPAPQVQPAPQAQQQTPVPQVQAAPAKNNTTATAEQPKAPVENKTKLILEKMKRGTVDSSFIVPIYDAEKAYDGTTLLPDNHDLSNPRIIEVNMLGEVIWEYKLPSNMKQYTNPGFDAEMLENGNILFTLPKKGVYEINRAGQIVWSYANTKVSHDADRLPNGNTLIVYGAFDTKEDAQAKEVNPAGKVVWSYYAKDYFGSNPAYKDISQEGWTHTNAATRLANGNTMVSLRNFNLLAEVDSQGKVVRTIESSEFVAQHDPAYLPNGNILFATHTVPQMAVEMDANKTVVWRFAVKEKKAWPVRDANRLPNGNTLVTASDRILEITPDGEIVWEFALNGITFTSQMEYASRGFYKAERLS